MKYAAAQQYAAELRELADFIEAKGHKMPDRLPSIDLYVYLTESDYVEVEGEWKVVLNEEKTKTNLRRFLEFVGTCDKDYHDDRLQLVRKFGRYIKLRGTVDRALTCRKVVKGTKMRQATFIPARMEEEVEWICDEQPSLLALVKDESV